MLIMTLNVWNGGKTYTMIQQISLDPHSDISDSDGNYGCGTAHLIFAYARALGNAGLSIFLRLN